MDSRVMVTIGILANFIVLQSHYSIGRDYAAVASAEIPTLAAANFSSGTTVWYIWSS
jgi:hypothetical protein